jgi:hypothetical protein
MKKFFNGARASRPQHEAGETPAAPLSFTLKAQKDCDARWAKKNLDSYYGDKNHVKTDVKHEILRDDEVTPASVRDSRVFESFFPDKPEEEKVRQTRERNEARPPEDEAYADSAYVHHADLLRDRGYEPKLCEKGCKNQAADGGAESQPSGKIQDTKPGGAHLRSDEIAGQG